MTEVERTDGSGSSPTSVVTSLDGMRAIGIDVDSVCAAAGCSYAELVTREALVPPALAVAIWREAMQRYPHGTIGIAVALAAPLTRDVVDYVASTSATFRIALDQVARYHRLITTNGDVQIRPEGDGVVYELLLNLPPGVLPPAIIEFALSCVIRRAIEYTGHTARALWLPHAALAPRDEYHRLLGFVPQFGTTRIGVVFDREALTAPCRASDPNLFRLLQSHAEALLAKEPRDASLRGQIRRIVLARVQDGEPEVADVAKQLAQSERSLQRHLKAEGTSFREVVDDARKELALGYLGDKKLTVSEVGYLLGYAEAGAFVRAFKRWTGRTPGEMRST